ncbi:unnamed protein product [Gongylonema pulchrum]|uniref:AMP-binding domain-containing protein n=1 Tax=Gongylonema pulchrum TaxID=637853 RepID=A0A183ERS2_9BILA|nr:unnamed protein product [Gongylonema pulchrum]
MSGSDSTLFGTLPELVYKCAKLDRVATVFDAEKITYTFQNVKNEVSVLMSGSDNTLFGTLPELIYKCAKLDRVATVFDAEKITYTFQNVKNEMDALAAGLLSTGLRPQDRVLICGSNTAHFFICSLACARADLIFSLMSPNFADAKQLQYALTKGEFRAIICFPASRETEFLNKILNELAPELMHSAKGRLCSKAVPKLTHVIMAEEEHKHA